MREHVTRSNELQWNALVEEGVRTEGLYVKVLRFDKEQQRPPTFLLKFDPGASNPNHNHPGGEEVYVLEGEVRFGATQLHAGDYLYTPPNATHSVYSRTGCVMLFMVPEEVDVL